MIDMDYEKLYKDALERARKFYNDCVKGDNPIQAQRYVDIFSELTESEDEKIRKYIVKFVELEKGVNLPPDDADKMLAYLEKQKEWKHAEQPDGTFTSYDMAKTFMEGQNYVIAHPEKFGLCKPAEWSKEDEGMLNCIIATLCEESHGGRETNERMVSWLDKLLKSLRPQPHWKPSKKQIWALEWNINNTPTGTWQRKELESLYKELLKL